MVGETRHLWVGNLPENVRDDKIMEHFTRYGHVENVTILPKRGPHGGVAAFVDFATIESAHKAHNAVNKMGDRDLRTDYNTPGTVRVLDETVSITSRSRASNAWERSYEHSAYGHHELTQLYDHDFRDPLDRTLHHGIYYNSRRSPSSFDAFDPRYETRYIYRTDSSRKARGTWPKRNYQHSRSRSPHSSQSRNQSPQPLASQASRPARTPSGSGSWSRSSSSDSLSSSSTDSLSSSSTRDVYRTDSSRKARGRRPKRNYQHSRSRSPHSSQSSNQSSQRLTSQASRPARSPSGIGSRSRSSSSDSLSSSTTSSDSDSSSTSSDESPARSVRSLSSMDKDKPRKSFGIKVQNLPVRSTESSLKNGLYHEFKKYGTVTLVQIHGVSEERYGLVFFRQQEDQEKALNRKGKLFFGLQIEVTAWVGPETESENEFRPFDEQIDEFNPKASRTLFIGNLGETTTHQDLRDKFQRFGEIVDIDVKMTNGAPQYAFVQYCDITSVCKAIKKMNGEYLGKKRLKLGFGKSVPTNCVWIAGLSSSVTEPLYLNLHFSRYGPVLKVVYDRLKGMALILYKEIEFAETAVKETKGRKIGGNVVKVDFASYEKQLAFFGPMESSRQDLRDFHGIISERRSDETRRGSFHDLTTTERTYYDGARTTGTYQEETRREYPARSREFFPGWESYQGDFYEQRYYDESREDTDLRDPYERAQRQQAVTPRDQPLLGEVTVGQTNTIYYSLLSAIAGRRQL
ncbi:msx2-interacting protein-like isoform X2 [Dendrobates tinctorius]|uniref:msx2-interacting protein-like isoform X2 n=1 Tax=Dendrobates tinctorius TaxID=92724 RepID=UPI003CC94BE9